MLLSVLWSHIMPEEAARWLRRRHRAIQFSTRRLNRPQMTRRRREAAAQPRANPPDSHYPWSIFPKSESPCRSRENASDKKWLF